MDLNGAARLALDLTAAIALVTAWVCLVHRRISALVSTYAIQSASLAVSEGLVAFLYQTPDLYLLAGTTVCVNVVVLPWVLRRVVLSLQVDRMVNMYASVRTSALVGLGLLLLSVLVAGPLTPVAEVSAAGLLPISTAMLLIGFFLLISRRKAITQVIGLLVMNNGILLAGVALTYGLGLFVELALAANLLVLAIVARIFLTRMKESFDHVDADALRALEG
jgi:hydrogenase-4 component E